MYTKRRKITIELVREEMKIENYILTSKIYVRQSEHLGFICPNGHIDKITYSNWHNGYRCGQCCTRTIKYTFEAVREAFISEGYTPLFSSYTNCKTVNLSFLCPDGHEHKICWDAWLNGNKRCGKCLEEKTNKKYFQGSRIYHMIVNRLDKQLKNYDVNWLDLYSENDIKLIADSIKDFYKNVEKSLTVDHIIPVSWFDFENKEELQFCWSLKNLRYIGLLENISRSNRPTNLDLEIMIDLFGYDIYTASEIPNHYLIKIKQLFTARKKCLETIK